MSKKYLIHLDGWLQERLEAEASKGIVGYTKMIELALSDFFDAIDEQGKRLEDFRLKK